MHVVTQCFLNLTETTDDLYRPHVLPPSDMQTDAQPAQLVAIFQPLQCFHAISSLNQAHTPGAHIYYTQLLLISVSMCSF